MFIQRRVAATDGAGTFRRGRAHVVDELIRLKAVTAPLAAGSVFVRGKVRHPDHRVLDLLEWPGSEGTLEVAAC